MQKVWFTADTHFGHKKIPFFTKRLFCLDEEEKNKVNNIWQTKNFNHDWSPSWSSVSRMDDHLIKKINEYVKENDILWHLGDFCFSNSQKESAKKYRDRINCRNIFLISGNHDSEKDKSVFSEFHERYELKYKSKFIVLSHYAQATWHKAHNKSWMLYGHSHGTAEDWLDAHMPGRLSMDVGVDNIFKILGEYRPISFEEINKIFESRSGMTVDGNKIKFTSKKNELK